MRKKKTSPIVLVEPSENGREELSTEIITAIVDDKIKHYRSVGIAFAIGISAFISLGLLTRGQLFQVICEGMYPPLVIFEKTKGQIHSEVWETLKSGSKEQYSGFLDRGEFKEAFTEQH
ncbi:MAG: hypothetical protein KC964_06960, partial [Candidatus Omnitrophica bacterium]|nr:hypothetical protein [Candidatus Omnitrophota bacterium]